MAETTVRGLPVGIGIVGDAPAERLRSLVSGIEALGYDGVWLADERFYRDPYPMLTLAALTAPRLRIGCAVTDPYSRHPAILEVDGELADAVMIGTFASEPGIRYAQERIARGAARAGRDPRAVPLFSWLYVAVDADPGAARGRVKRGLATAIFGSRGVLDQIGIRLPPALADLLGQFDYDALADPATARRVMGLIPDDLVGHLAVAGTVDDVAEQLAGIARLGVGELAIWPFPPDGTDWEHEIVPLAEEVMPRVQRALEAQGA